MPTDDETFAQQRQMAVTRALRPRAFSHTTYVDGAYDSYDPGEGGGEGGLEELAFADFANGVYRIGGGTVAVGVMFVQSVDYGSGSFNPVSHIDSQGLHSGGSPIVTSGLATTLLASGYTAIGVLAIRAAAASNTSGGVRITSQDLPDWNAGSETRLYFNKGAPVPMKNTEAIASSGAQLQSGETSPGPFYFAVTITPTRASLSINGSAVLTDTTTDPLALDYNSVGIQMDGVGCLQNITFYPPQADAALPGLSVAS